ncbi:MAG: Tol-Pal system beta propeller repeat protein TolB [Beijerinckiaceae bacterium]|nr:Tol-Pal system beta propeller repeat protein TolB [Beijerinckiaceae bacterium]
MPIKTILKAACVAVAAALSPLAFVGQAHAELFVDVRGGNFQPLPIAIVDFGGDPQGIQVAGVITNNLSRSGLFVPLDKAKFPESQLDFDSNPNFAAWKATGVQALITGRVTREGGKLKAQFRLWDVTSGQQTIGQQYFTDPQSWRRVAHIISDAVYTKVTGDKGFFDTRIVYVDETGPKDKRRKRLAIIDQDGANFKALSNGDSLVVTPRFSPNSQEVAYMAFGGGDPKVYKLDVASGRRDVVGNFPGMSFAPRFSPDGSRIVMSLQEGGNSNIYVTGANGGAPQRLTSTSAIDTSPSYSPDGSQIVFESDRGGGQQIYVMGADGSGQKRISFGGGNYSTPVWSPKGDLIAFTKQSGSTFAIGVMKPDGSGEKILAEGFHNEGPTWAPNGRYIMFFRDPSGSGGPKLHMVDVNGRVDVPVPTPGYASDPAWSPLLTDLRQ